MKAPVSGAFFCTFERKAMQKFNHNEAASRFELQIDNKVAFIDYQKSGEVYKLTHTEVPKELEGRGIAKSLTTQSLEFISSAGGRFIPLCPYIASFVARNPEWQPHVAQRD